MPKNVFLGLNNTAGVCSRLKTGFKENNIDSQFYSYSQHIYGYKTDKLIAYSPNKIIRFIQKVLLIVKLLIRFKFFIFDSASTLLSNYLDIKILRFFGKKTMMIFTGCDIRIPEKVLNYKWNPCFECNEEYKNFVNCVIEPKKEMIKKVEKLFDIIVAPTEAAGYLERKYYHAYFPVNLQQFPKIKKNDLKLNKRLRILHAPSNPVYKGTKYILEAINKLNKEFDFEFVTVTKVPIDTLYEEIKKSDLIIDQMLTGIYGLFTIESMAMYKPVVCYVREDSWNLVENECPIYNTDADNLYETLLKILQNPSQLIERGYKSRDFVEKFHNAKTVAKQYYDLLEKNN